MNPQNISAKGPFKCSGDKVFLYSWQNKCNWKFSQYMILFCMLMTEDDWLFAVVLCRHLRESSKESERAGLREIRRDWILIVTVLSLITITSSFTHPLRPSIFFFLSPNPSFPLCRCTSPLSLSLCLRLPPFILSCQSKEKPGSKLRQGLWTIK